MYYSLHGGRERPKALNESVKVECFSINIPMKYVTTESDAKSSKVECIYVCVGKFKLYMVYFQSKWNETDAINIDTVT